MAVTMAEQTPSEASLAQSQATLLYILFAIPIPLEIISTLFRLYVKIHKTTSRRIAADDYLMIIATIVSVTLCVVAIVDGPSNGLGRRVATVSKEDISKFRKGNYIFSHFYNLAITTTKLSVLALYHRIFETPPFHRLIYMTTAFIVAWIIVMELVLGFGCRPTQNWWGSGENCLNRVAFTFFTNITNLVTDIWIFSLPIPTLMRLQALKKHRASLIVLFSIGLVTCLISAARIGFVFAAGSIDMLWWGGPLAILSCWEPCGGVLCANLPIVYKTFVAVLKSVRSTLTGRSKIHSNQDSSKANSEPRIHHNRRNSNWLRIQNIGNISDNDSTIWNGNASSHHKTNNIVLDGIVVHREPTSGMERRSMTGQASDTDTSSNFK